jgi:hypothetical protein
LLQEASDWPTDCRTGDERSAYISNFLDREGIQLDADNIAKNPGLRSLAKLMLNSFWGKFGQRENQPRTKIINRPDDFFKLLANPAMEVYGVLPINEDVLVVSYAAIEEAYDPLTTVNVVIAAYTTAQARLKLYTYLEKLQERVLYYDTDSVIFTCKSGESDIPTGTSIGDLTDELEGYGPGSYITKFVSGGPKNYAYEVTGGATTAKVKGITLNHVTSQLVNFRKMAEMILMESDPVPVITTNIRRTADHRLVTRQETKMYRPNSLKRRFDGHDSVPYGFKRVRE